jgi:hypothetical protein
MSAGRHSNNGAERCADGKNDRDKNSQPKSSNDIEPPPRYGARWPPYIAISKDRLDDAAGDLITPDLSQKVRRDLFRHAFRAS